jgi:hypothetical protein
MSGFAKSVEAKSICVEHLRSSSSTGIRNTASRSPYVPEGLARFEAIRQLYQLKMEVADENLSLRAGGVREYTEASFVSESCRLIEILAGAGRREEAERVQALALALSPSAEAREALGKALRHQEPES